MPSFRPEVCSCSSMGRKKDGFGKRKLQDCSSWTSHSKTTTGTSCASVYYVTPPLKRHPYTGTFTQTRKQTNTEVPRGHRVQSTTTKHQLRVAQSRYTHADSGGSV
ncbi:hypothetical protein AMECASPLE_025628 [Ameca splendens]|uniref:Uncharacterized protein n=1 Tax=Ameca splendens TaxID=208324 RepID=A0ABV0Z3A2_9TELE